MDIRSFLEKNFSDCLQSDGKKSCTKFKFADMFDTMDD